MKRLILVAIILLMACVELQLERKMPQDIRNWYEQHWIIMEYPVPKDLGGQLERLYFLRLSVDLQRKYIQNFWTLRDIVAKDEYALRMSVVMRWFRSEGIDPWNTDVGRVLLLCGQPDYEDKYDEEGMAVMGDDEEWLAPDVIRYWVWKYWWGDSFFSSLISLRFLWRNGKWVYLESMEARDRDFIQYWRWKMAPTEEGWELWRTIL